MGRATARIVVVEDDPDILEMVSYNLRRAGFHVEKATTGEQAIDMLQDGARVDLVLLDLMLPGASGFDVCQWLRSRPETAAVPIVMLTARGDESDVVRGLELGADDYVTKPFSPRVLLARIQAVLRRGERRPRAGDPISIGDVTLDPERHHVAVSGEPLRLTQTEFRILQLLMSRAGWVCTRSQIVEALHDGFLDVSERSVDVQIVSLRRKLGDAAELIETVRGIGYRFAVPQEGDSQCGRV